jgi:hypothetical protein
MDRQRCDVCDRVVATDADHDALPEHGGADLCWRAWEPRQCEAERVDWRAVARGAEAEVTRLRALMAGRAARPTPEEFAALGAVGATLRVRWANGDDEIPARDPNWIAVATVPEGARWWAHGPDGALIEWPVPAPQEAVAGDSSPGTGERTSEPSGGPCAASYARDGGGS